MTADHYLLTTGGHVGVENSTQDTDDSVCDAGVNVLPLASRPQSDPQLFPALEAYNAAFTSPVWIATRRPVTHPDGTR